MDSKALIKALLLAYRFGRSQEGRRSPGVCFWLHHAEWVGMADSEAIAYLCKYVSLSLDGCDSVGTWLLFNHNLFYLENTDADPDFKHKYRLEWIRHMIRSLEETGKLP